MDRRGGSESLPGEGGAVVAGCTQDLVLGGEFLQLALQALVVGEEGGGVGGEGVKFVLKVFDVAFFALAEGTLSERVALSVG